jgi:hypothetical protein
MRRQGFSAGGASGPTARITSINPGVIVVYDFSFQDHCYTTPRFVLTADHDPAPADAQDALGAYHLHLINASRAPQPAAGQEWTPRPHNDTSIRSEHSPGTCSCCTIPGCPESPRSLAHRYARLPRCPVSNPFEDPRWLAACPYY